MHDLPQTPLFFRFRNVNEIPKRFFEERRVIHGRIIAVLKKDSNAGFKSSKKLSESSSNNHPEDEKPIVFLMHHLSPMGRLLNKPAFEFFQKYSPSLATRQMIKTDRMNDSGNHNYNNHNLLKIEIAGITSPPDNIYSNSWEGQNEWLNQLCRNKTRVSCQLFARRISTQTGDENDYLGQAAIAKVYFRPGWNKKDNSRFDAEFTFPSLPIPIFQKDLALSLLQYGRATVTSSSGNPLFANQFNSSYIESINSNPNHSQTKLIQSHQKHDVAYLETLINTEMKAAQYKQGIWGSEELRQDPKFEDLVKEVDMIQERKRWSVWKKCFFWMKSKIFQ